MLSPPGKPSCSGTDANTAAANPFGIITDMALLSKELADEGEKNLATITLTPNRAKVIIAPIMIEWKSEKGILKPT